MSLTQRERACASGGDQRPLQCRAVTFDDVVAGASLQLRNRRDDEFLERARLQRGQRVDFETSQSVHHART